MSADELFTRDEVLSGLPAQRAHTLLYLIESQTAHRVAQSREVMARFLTEAAAQERELEFLEAFALGRDPPLKPTIQDLERHAEQWARLVPENPRLRAALAHLLGQKYPLSYPAAPSIRKALALDTEAVQQAYQRQYRQPLGTVFIAQLGPLERLRWASSALSRWLNNLPPFWTAFSLTLTETVGASVLALPIALAEIGPLAGVVLLILLGLVNVVTVIYVAETLTRTGSVRFGNAYFGRIVTEYLGGGGSFIFTLALGFLNLLVLIAYYIGIAKTMESATHLPAALWALLVFLLGLYFIRRETMNATITSALLVGAVNIALILTLSALAAPYIRMENLSYINVPFLGGRPFEPSILHLVFGIILAAYFGHTSIANCAKVVLQREPSGRSLIGGSMAAQVAAIFLYALWLLAVNGSVEAGLLAGQSGTALIPLAGRVGPVVYVFGTAFVLLGMGMASIHFSLGTYNLVRERLPSQHQPVVKLPRRRGILIFRPKGDHKGGLRVGLVYLGLGGDRPRFRIEAQYGAALQSLETEAAGQWDAGVLLGRLLGQGIPNLYLKVEILDANPQSARLQISTPMAITYEGEWEPSGLELADLLDLPGEQRRLMKWMIRQGEADLSRIAAYTGLEERQMNQVLTELATQGYLVAVETPGGTRYRASLAMKRGRQLPQEIWKDLDGQGEPLDQFSPVEQSWKRYLGARSRFLMGATPVFLVFLLVEWLILTHSESFTEPLNFAGVIVVSLIGGVFPALLLLSSRRKGEISPGKSYRFLGHPLVIAGIYLLYMASVFLHGLLIWQNPFQRIVALLTVGLMLIVTLRIARHGAFAPCVVVELRKTQEGGGETHFSVTANGEPAVAQVRLMYRDHEQVLQAAEGKIPASPALCAAEFHLPAGIAQDLKIWAHQVNLEGNSESLPAIVRVFSGDNVQRSELKLTNEQVLIPLDDKPSRIKIELEDR